MAADLLNDRVLPFFEARKVRLSRVLTDRDTEYCGTDSHEYELYFVVEDIDHTALRLRASRLMASVSVFGRRCSMNFVEWRFVKTSIAPSMRYKLTSIPG